MNEQETDGGKPHIEFSKVALLVQFGISTLLTLLSVTAFFMGPLIDFFNRKVARPFLERHGDRKRGDRRHGDRYTGS